MNALKDWLRERIARYDRMVDDAKFPVDQQIYNLIAHELRAVLEKVKELEKK